MVDFNLSFTVFLFFCLMKLKLFIKCHFYCRGLLRGSSCLYSIRINVNLQQSFRETYRKSSSEEHVQVIFSPFLMFGLVCIGRFVSLVFPPTVTDDL